MKMVRQMILLLFVFSTMSMSCAQTFQYSRGWTNGKRAGHPHVSNEIPDDYVVLPSIAGVPVSGNQIPVDLPTSCQFQKLKMLLRGAATEQVYLLPCDVLGSSTTSGGDLPLAEYSTLGLLRRPSTLDHRNN